MFTNPMRIITILIVLFGFSEGVFCQKLPKSYGKVESRLFLSDSTKHLLLVAFGGSEGGNTFAGEQTKSVREQFLNRGFHFLSINYFGSKGLPKYIDRISLSAINDTIQNISKNLGISDSNILFLGASRGGELVLNLACRSNCMGVIALVPSNITIPNYNSQNATSSWTFNDMELPFSDIDETLIKKEGWFRAIGEFLACHEQKDSSFIPIENTRGFVLLTSGKSDVLWPSYQMCNDMIYRLKQKSFGFPFKHIAFDDGHNPANHWPKVFTFLDFQLQKSKE